MAERIFLGAGSRLCACPTWRMSEPRPEARAGMATVGPGVVIHQSTRCRVLSCDVGNGMQEAGGDGGCGTLKAPLGWGAAVFSLVAELLRMSVSQVVMVVALLSEVWVGTVPTQAVHGVDAFNGGTLQVSGVWACAARPWCGPSANLG